MRAEELIARAAARGVDLASRAPPKGAEQRHRATVRRRFASGHRATVLAEPHGFAAHGTATRGSEQPEWSLAEIAQAAAGVPPIPFAAACYAFAGDDSQYWPLWRALHRGTITLAQREEWPAQVRGIDGRERFYWADLAALVLDADMHAHLFATVPELPAICLGVTERTWVRVLSKRYAVEYRWQCWLATAHEIIQPRLSCAEIEPV